METDEPTENICNLNQKLEKALVRIKELNEMAVEIEEKGEISMTDPDSRHMSVSNNGTDIAHNVQTAVDEKNHLIVAVDVTSNAQDNGQLAPMADMAKAELGVDEIIVLADKGYYNGECLKHCQENGIENFELYKKRQMIVEHPFGTIKRALGYTYFLTRGNENVKNESYLHCLTYNLKRVINIMGIPPLIEAIKAKMAKQYGVIPIEFCHFLRILSFWGKHCQILAET